MTTNKKHRDLQPLICEGGIFDVEPCEMDLNVGRRGRFVAPTCEDEEQEFEIVGIQKNYRGEVCYRVITDGDVSRFGRVAHPSTIKLI